MANTEHIEVLQIKPNQALWFGGSKNKQVWYWHWKAENGENIATSGEPFYSKGDAYDAAERIVQKLEDKCLPIKIIE